MLKTPRHLPGKKQAPRALSFAQASEESVSPLAGKKLKPVY